MTWAPRIVLLHATPVAMKPVHDAFSHVWPAAEPIDLLDTALTTDRQRDAELTEDLTDRLVDFARYGYRIGAQAVLATCSAFGSAIDRADRALPIPVAKPNEAMFRAALAMGRRIGMLATFAPSVASMSAEFAELAAGTCATLDVICVDEAIDALRRGDAGTHNRLVSQRATELAGHDVIMLAHFSTSTAAAETRAAVSVPVLTAPESAVTALRDLIVNDNGGNE